MSKSTSHQSSPEVQPSQPKPPQHKPLPREWVLVTGAASGIGAELCRLFARDGVGIVLVDRNGPGMEKMCAELEAKFDVRTASLVVDLSAQEAADIVHSQLNDLGIAVDVLVNNAGFGTYGNFWETDAARDRALVNVNILTPMMLSKYLLPGMVQRGRGGVLNVGSVSGFLASPYATTYYSSKAFLLSFSQGLATSLKGTGVGVTVICPGPTYTAFNWHSTDDGAPPPPRKRFQMDAAVVAAQAHRGFRRRQMVVIPGVSNKALAVLAKLLPRRFALWLLTAGQNGAN